MKRRRRKLRKEKWKEERKKNSVIVGKERKMEGWKKGKVGIKMMGRRIGKNRKEKNERNEKGKRRKVKRWRRGGRCCGSPLLRGKKKQRRG